MYLDRIQTSKAQDAPIAGFSRIPNALQSKSNDLLGFSLTKQKLKPSEIDRPAKIV
jgi:hypothetical protein